MRRKRKPRKNRTSRRPKTNRVARTRAHNTWTEASFWSFIRSNLRRLSRRWPPLVKYAADAARRKYKGPNKQQKWEYQCSCCKRWYLRRLIQIDHIKPCGSLKSFEDVGPFLRRLLVEVEGLRVLCLWCHTLRGVIDKFLEACK